MDNISYLSFETINSGYNAGIEKLKKRKPTSDFWYA